MLCRSGPVSAALCPRKALLITALPSPSASVPCHRWALPAVAAALPLRALRGPAEPLPIDAVPAQSVPLQIRPLRINPYAPLRISVPMRIVSVLGPSVPSRRYSRRGNSIAIHCSEYQFRCKSLLISALPLPISAYQGNSAASQSFALVAIQCPRVAYPRKADPICALANLGLQILCHSRLCNASATYCLSIP